MVFFYKNQRCDYKLSTQVENVYCVFANPATISSLPDTITPIIFLHWIGVFVEPPVKVFHPPQAIQAKMTRCCHPDTPSLQVQPPVRAQIGINQGMH